MRLWVNPAFGRSGGTQQRLSAAPGGKGAARRPVLVIIIVMLCLASQARAAAFVKAFSSDDVGVLPSAMAGDLLPSKLSLRLLQRARSRGQAAADAVALKSALEVDKDTAMHNLFVAWSRAYSRRYTSMHEVQEAFSIFQTSVDCMMHHNTPRPSTSPVDDRDDDDYEANDGGSGGGDRREAGGGGAWYGLNALSATPHRALAGVAVPPPPSPAAASPRVSPPPIVISTPASKPSPPQFPAPPLPSSPPRLQPPKPPQAVAPPPIGLRSPPLPPPPPSPKVFLSPPPKIPTPKPPPDVNLSPPRPPPPPSPRPPKPQPLPPQVSPPPSPTLSPPPFAKFSPPPSPRLSPPPSPRLSPPPSPQSSPPPSPRLSPPPSPRLSPPAPPKLSPPSPWVSPPPAVLVSKPPPVQPPPAPKLTPSPPPPSPRRPAWPTFPPRPPLPPLPLSRPTPPVFLSATLYRTQITGGPQNVTLPPPPRIDWRTTGKLTKVKDQGSSCASCWINSAVSAVEAALSIAYASPPMEFSRQILVDCANGDVVSGPTFARDSGCYGRDPADALLFMNIYTIPTEKAYRYLAMPDVCTISMMSLPASDITWLQAGRVTFYPANSEIYLQAAVAIQPVVIYWNMGFNFQGYAGGVYSIRDQTDPIYGCLTSFASSNHAM